MLDFDFELFSPDSSLGNLEVEAFRVGENRVWGQSGIKGASRGS